MESKVPAYLALVEKQFDDKDVDNLIGNFRDPDKRKEFFKEYKEVEMLYEIISPDPGFWSQVQQGYAKRICTSLPSSLRIA